MGAQDAELLTVRQTARLVGRSEETVRRWIWSGKISAQKLGNQLFVRRDQIARASGGRSPNTAPSGTADGDEYPEWLERSRRIARQIFSESGYIDVAAAVRESHEEH